MAIHLLGWLKEKKRMLTHTTEDMEKSESSLFSRVECKPKHLVYTE